MSTETATTAVVVDVVVVVVVIGHILDGQCSCPVASEEEKNDGNEQ
jgi:hypothetical protein